MDRKQAVDNYSSYSQKLGLPWKPFWPLNQPFPVLSL
jgi:hypothetical protein